MIKTNLYLCLELCILLLCGCNAPRPSESNDAIDTLADTPVIVADIDTAACDSIVTPDEPVQSAPADSSPRAKVTDNPPRQYEYFVKLEVNKKEGYEVRRVNELVFANSAATDTVLAALRELAPVQKRENLTIYVYPYGIIHLEKTGIHGPRMVVEDGEKYEYYFGFLEIDTFFIDVVGFKSEKYDVAGSAQNLFNKTGHTRDYEYKYYSPYPGGGPYYHFAITDSTVTTLRKGHSE